MVAQIPPDPTNAGASRRDRIAVVLALCLTAVTVGACGSDKRPENQRPLQGRQLAIYASAPLHGPASAVGEAILRAQRLALAQDGGRIGRYRVRLVTLDAARPFTGGSDPAKVSLNARRAARDPQTVAYLGEVSSGASAVSIPLLNKAGILEVSPLDSALALTTPSLAITGSPERYYPNAKHAGRTFARLVPNDGAQAEALLDYMGEEGVERVAVLTDQDGPGQALATAVRGAARGHEVRVVVSDEVDAHQQQHPELVAEVVAQRPDAVLYAGGLREVAAGIWRELTAADPKLSLFVPSALADTWFAARLPARGGGVYATQPLPRTLAEDTPAARGFVRAFKARHGSAPPAEALYGYESMRITLAAIRAAVQEAGDGSISRDDVVKAFFEIPRREGALGSYRIDSRGDTSQRAHGAYRMVGGRLRYVRSIEIER